MSTSRPSATGSGGQIAVAGTGTSQQTSIGNAATTSGRPVSASSNYKIPYSMTQEYGEQRFSELYQKALERKRLFKEYLQRNQVLERLNSAIEALYEQETLPADPMEFVVAYVKAPASQQQQMVAGRPMSARSAVGAALAAGQPGGGSSTGAKRMSNSGPSIGLR